ncbi:MAG: universal stress protein [Bdellovibrionales bacterium]
MSAPISRKLSNAFEGALAGGGDPATSPLYVFGPFLKLIILAGVADITFGATLWLAVFTVVMVSLMYRQVMSWVTDGSGGSGLAEEEFGSWAVKINAGITVIEYTLTFLVSMSALVTFAADRFNILNHTVAGFQYRVFLALALSFLIGWIVNLGPKVSVRVFGPATAAVLLLLWSMVALTLFKTGLHLPDFNLQAFSFADSDGQHGSYINVTFAGYARILALMTGIEVFANLVAAYDGTRAERSRKAFGSLMIVMGTTMAAMLVLGPMIHAHADPLHEHVSVFTQAMDFLFPPWASHLGTLIGIVVLLSACAAAAQGIQNLALGLGFRHYIPPRLSQRNSYDVAPLPVWILIGTVSLCFFLFGAKEETFLALYAAGVFVLLSMTGWAASKRIGRELKQKFTPTKLLNLGGTIIAATLTSCATLIIFAERFTDGAWSYLLLIPAFYLVFSLCRRKFGAPPNLEDWFGRVMFSQGYVPQVWYDKDKRQEAAFTSILVPLNGKPGAEQVLPLVREIAHAHGATVHLLTVNETFDADERDPIDYLRAVSHSMNHDGISTEFHIGHGDIAKTIDQRAFTLHADMIAMTIAAAPALTTVFNESMVNKVIKQTLTPVFLVRSTEHWRNRYSSFRRLLVALDGSEVAESVLPYIRAFTSCFQSQVFLLFVVEDSETPAYTKSVESYLNTVAETLRREDISASPVFLGDDPARTILSVIHDENIDLVMMASHGRGGLNRPSIHLGSVTAKVIRETDCPVFVVPLTKKSR